MQAIILAAGRGSRLKELTKDKPKPATFVEVRNTPIIKKMLENLRLMGISEVIIATGYRKEYLPKALGPSYKGMPIRYVEIQGWEEANNAHGLYQLQNVVHEDLLIIEGDEYFSEPFLSKEKLEDKNNYWLGSLKPVTGCLLFSDDSGKLIDLDIIRDKEKMEQLTQKFHKSCGVVKITKEYTGAFFKGLGEFVAQPENKKKYFDNYIKENLDIFPVQVYELDKHIVWGEVDDAEDLKELEEELIEAYKKSVISQSKNQAEDFNYSKRDKHWNTFPVIKKNDLLYHLSGADKDLSKTGFKIENELLLYYFYRFILEKKLLQHLIKKYVKSKTRALDAGCGTGRNTLTLSKQFKMIDAFDLSDVFIEENKTRFSAYKNIIFSKSDFSYIEHVSEKYDLIFIGGVFMCMSDDEIKNVLIALRKRLKKGGILVMRDTLSRNETVVFNAIKKYRSEHAYETLFSENGYTLLEKLNGPTRNLWCSIFYRLPEFFKKNDIIFNLFKILVRVTIYIDCLILNRKPFVRHSKSSQLFYVFTT